jgi:hypothetical protein
LGEEEIEWVCFDDMLNGEGGGRRKDGI